MLRQRSRQLSRVRKYIWGAHELGKYKTEGGTTPHLARKLPQRFADFFCLALGDFYTVKLTP